jgi:O-antigen ligase
MKENSLLRRYGARTLVPTFLVLAAFTGGSSFEAEHLQAIMFGVSAFLLAAFFGWGFGWITGPVKSVIAFAFCLALLAGIQLFPFPTEMTASLPDRDAAYHGLNALGHSPAAFSLSLSPEATQGAFLAFLMPLAAFCLVARLKWSRGAALLKWTIPLLGAASAVLGLAQVFLGNEPRLYLYDRTSEGLPAGFFANVNHQASFLLMTLPFVAALAADLQRGWQAGDSQVAQAVILAACGLLIIGGVFGAGSVAGYILLAPVTLLSILILGGGRQRSNGPIFGAGLAVGIILFAGAFVFTSPVLEGLGITSLDDSDLSRIGIARTSAEILDRHWQFGTGLGAFDEVYHLYEDPATVVYVYVAHVHNDYMEWLIETGLAGGILLGAFLVWFLVWFVRVWTNSKSGASGLRRAASIACLVILLHSFVDYPLRTPVIAALGAMCLALMIVPRTRDEAPLSKEETAAGNEVRIVTL